MILQKEEFLRKISFSSHFVSHGTTSIKALQGVYLHNKKKVLHFYSTNLNSFFHTTLPTKEEKEIKAIIEPKKIEEFLSLLSPGQIEMEIEVGKLIIKQDKIKGTFPLMVQEDFPLPPQGKEEVQMINNKFLEEKLPLVLFSASKDDSRPVLNAINFVSRDGELFIVSTDGFRLSLIKTKGEKYFENMIIPSAYLSETLKSSKEEKQTPFYFFKNEKTVMFKTKDGELYSRLVEGDFPQFEKAIPTESKTTVVLDREELLRSVKIASVLARDQSSVVVCDFKKNELYIRPKTETKEENNTYQEIELTGEEQKVAFNYKFILDFLNSVDCKKITIEILRPDAPVVFKIEKNEEFLHIIMPVRIQEL